MILGHVKDVVGLKGGIDSVNFGELGGIGRSGGTCASQLGLEADRICLGFSTLMESQDLVSNEVRSVCQITDDILQARLALGPSRPG